MINVALAIIFAIIFISGKMPLVGGRMIRGTRARLVGASAFAISFISLFLPTNLNILLNLIVIVILSAIYFLARGEPQHLNKRGANQFASIEEEKITYKYSLIGLGFTAAILFVIGGVVWLLVTFIKGL